MSIYSFFSFSFFLLPSSLFLFVTCHLPPVFSPPWSSSQFKKLPPHCIVVSFSIYSSWLCVCKHHCLSFISCPVHWKREKKGEKRSCVLFRALHLCLPLSKQELLSRVEDSLWFALRNWISSSLGSFDFNTEGKASYQHALPWWLLPRHDG